VSGMLLQQLCATLISVLCKEMKSGHLYRNEIMKSIRILSGLETPPGNKNITLL
jgi:hypothetical protein